MLIDAPGGHQDGLYRLRRKARRRYCIIPQHTAFVVVLYRILYKTGLYRLSNCGCIIGEHAAQQHSQLILAALCRNANRRRKMLARMSKPGNWRRRIHARRGLILSLLALALLTVGG